MKKTPPKRRTPVSKRNTRRRKSEFVRCYGSKERVAFVRSLACSACGVVGYSENAHVPPKGEAGTGYKAAYRFIAPLCRENAFGLERNLGCHLLYDRYPVWFGGQFPSFDPEKAAAETEAAWLAHTEEGK